MTDETDLAFGERLRRSRLAAGLTQEQLAERARLSPAAVSTLERGTRQAPRQETVALLARALRLSPEERLALAASVSRRRGPAGIRASARQPAPLPVPLSSFVGRERDLAELAVLLAVAAARLVTLTGPPGSGKTRLAVEAAARAASAYHGGAAFVSLAALRDPALVLPSVAHALGLRLQPDRPLLDPLRRHLAAVPRLLLLDNAEQVADCAPDLAALLAGCPRLTLLVTSRVSLRVSGERVVAVGPLALPDPTAPAEEVLQAAAVRMFSERAREQVPGLMLGPADAAVAAELVRRLDGLPLAIELAAARLRVLPPRVLLARLGPRLPLLVGGARDLPERQRTLLAAITWSYDLLKPGEQALFRRLAVCVGSFTLDVAKAVTGAPGDTPIPVLEGIEALVVQSLLRREDVDGPAPRFGMLETIREYALERLEASGEAAATHDRHAAYMLALAEAGTSASGTDVWDEGLDWGDARLATLGREIADLRAALDWALRSGAAETALRLCCALAWFWWLVGPWDEGRRALEQALALAGDAPPALRARAHRALARFFQPLGVQGKREIEAHTERALALLRTAGDHRGVGWLLLHLGGNAQLRGDGAAAERHYQEALEALAAVDDRRGVARAQVALATLLAGQGQHAAAEAAMAAARAAFRGLGDQRGEADVPFAVGGIYRDAGDAARARPLLEAAAAAYRRLRERNTLGLALTSLGDARRRLGDLERARAALDEAIALGRAIRAPQLLRFASYVRWQLTLDEGNLAAAREQGAMVLAVDRELAGANTSSFVLAGAARLAQAASAPECSVRLLAAADVARLQEDWAWSRADLLDMQPVREAGRAALGDEGFAAAWAVGKTLMPAEFATEVEALTATAATTRARH